MRADRGVRNPRYQGGWVGAAIGAIASLIGANQQKKSAHGQRQANIDMQREFAQQGIQWRVEDAQAAGVHPLYAMGSGGAAFSPNPITANDGGWGEVGQNISGAIQRNADKEGKELNMKLLEAQLEAANAGSAKDYAQAAYWWSQVGQGGNGSPGQGNGAVIPGSAVATSPLVGQVEMKAPEQLAPAVGDRSRTGALQPGIEAIQFPDFKFGGASPIQMDERLGEVGQALLLPYLLGHSVRDELSDYFQRTWPIRSMFGDRIVTREDMDYERWKKKGLSPRGWNINREYFNRRR